MKFALRIQAINKGGSLNTTDGKFIVRNADEVIFLLTADTDYKLNFNPDFKDPKTYVGPDPDQTTLAMLDAAAAKITTNYASDTKRTIPNCLAESNYN